MRRERRPRAERLERNTRHERGAQFHPAHTRLPDVLDRPAHDEQLRRPVRQPHVQAGAFGVAAIQRHREAGGKRSLAAGQPRLVGVPAAAAVKHVALVGECQAAGVEAQTELA